MSKNIAILGASGHGKVVAEIAELTGWTAIDFFDDRWPTLPSLEVWNVVGNSETLLAKCRDYAGVIVAIGDNKTRLSKQQKLLRAGANITTLVHPKAVVSAYSSLGQGSVVMANSVINSFSTVGMAAIVNTSSTIDHDCQLGDAVHISPGAHLAGGVIISDCSWIGIGASVKQLIQIGENVVVGVGSAVIGDIDPGLTVAGIPAKPPIIKY